MDNIVHEIEHLEGFAAASATVMATSERRPGQEASASALEIVWCGRGFPVGAPWLSLRRSC